MAEPDLDNLFQLDRLLASPQVLADRTGGYIWYVANGYVSSSATLAGAIWIFADRRGPEQETKETEDAQDPGC